MSIHQEIVLSDGTPTKQADSVCFVSFWRIPGGYDYTNAYVVEAYFSDRDAAARIQKKYEMPPEMTYLIDLPVTYQPKAEMFRNYPEYDNA